MRLEISTFSQEKPVNVTDQYLMELKSNNNKVDISGSVICCYQWFWWMIQNLIKVSTVETCS